MPPLPFVLLALALTSAAIPSAAAAATPPPADPTAHDAAAEHAEGASKRATKRTAKRSPRRSAVRRPARCLVLSAKARRALVAKARRTRASAKPAPKACRRSPSAPRRTAATPARTVPLAGTPAPTPPAAAPAPGESGTTTEACCASLPVTGVTAPASTPAAPVTGKLAVGLNINANPWPDPGHVLDKATFLGHGWIREELEWSAVEPQRGTFSWGRYDKLFTSTAQRGLNVLLLLTSPPSWAGPSKRSLPNDAADYGRFVAAAVARYGSTGSFWAEHPTLPKVPAMWFELWNEPYIQSFSQSGLDPAAYTRLVKAGTTAGRAANPAARFMIEASPYGDGLADGWTEAMYQAMPELNAYFDAVAVHAYGMDLDAPRAQFRRTFEDVRATLVTHGAADRPLWVTEMGWSTCPGPNPDCTSEAGQAGLLARALEAVRTRYASYVAGVILYSFQDQFGQRRPDDSQPYYGFVRPDDSPKPAADVLRRFTAGLT